MCMVSVISGYGRDLIPMTTWTPDAFSHYQEILRMLAELDKKLNQPDCEDETKTAWMKDVEKRLKELETIKKPRLVTLLMNESNL